MSWIVATHLSMEFSCTIQTTQVDKNPIHMGHPSPAEILSYSCGMDRLDQLLYLYHAGWPGLSCREVDLDIGVNATGMIRRVDPVSLVILFAVDVTKVKCI